MHAARIERKRLLTCMFPTRLGYLFETYYVQSPAMLMTDGRVMAGAMGMAMAMTGLKVVVMHDVKGDWGWFWSG